jgi:23S rRNA (adenine2503-C2)-methyltransferase
MNKADLCGLTVEEVYGLIRTGGFELKHAVAVAHTIYKKGSMDLAQTSKIPKRLKAFLRDVSQTGFYSPSASEVSSDGTVKYLFRTFGGKQFETVIIPDLRRNTLCVSTQAGCRMECPFCVTGKYGFHGNLSTGDIVNQVISIPFAE